MKYLDATPVRAAHLARIPGAGGGTGTRGLRPGRPADPGAVLLEVPRPGEAERRPAARPAGRGTRPRRIPAGGRSRPARPTRASSSGGSRRSDAEERMPPKSDPLGRDEIRILRAWIDQGADWPETAAAAANGRKAMVVTAEDRQHWSYRPLEPRRSPGSPRCGLVSHPDRPVRPRGPRGARHSPECPGRPAHPDPPGLFRPARPAPFARGGEGVRRGPGARRLREAGRPPPRQPALRRAMGPALARRRPLCGQRRAGVRRRPADRVSLPRLRDPGPERRPVVPDLRALADRGRRIRARRPRAPWRPRASWRPRRPRCWTVPMEEEKLRLRFNELDDMAVTTASAFLGLTLGCARCHDHKYDAIPTRDYYRLQCAFTTTRREEALLVDTSRGGPVSRAGLAMEGAAEGGPGRAGCLARRAEEAAHRLPADGEDRRPGDRRRGQGAPEGAARLGGREETRQAACEGPRDLGRRLSARLLRRAAPAMGCPQGSARGGQAVGAAKAADGPRDRRPAGRRPSRPGCSIAGTSMRRRSGCRSASSRCSPARDRPRITGTPRAGRSRRIAAPASDGRWRTGSPTWIRGPGPLLARVMVNRVWQHHFGEGLVRTVGDFGVRGERPTHPGAAGVARPRVRGGGLAAQAAPSPHPHECGLHAGYDLRCGPRGEGPRRSPAVAAPAAAAGGRGPARRGAVGERHAEPGSPSGPRTSRPSRPRPCWPGTPRTRIPRTHATRESTRRRTVYMFHKRVVQHPLMQAFDGPDAAVSCGRRNVTTVAPQALALLNDTFLRDRAADLARRLLAEGGATPEGWVTRGLRAGPLAAPERGRTRGVGAVPRDAAPAPFGTRQVPGARGAPAAGPHRFRPGALQPERVHLCRLSGIKAAGVTPCPATRREFLARAGAGLGLCALADLLCSPASAADDRRPGRPARAASPALRPEGHLGHLAVHGGRTERRGPVRPQAGARQEPRQAGGDRRLQRQPGPADEVAVRLPAVRRVRRVGLREVPERRAARRRHRVRQVVLHRVERSRARALPDEHGGLPGGAADRGRLGHLRPGEREPEPARVRRAREHARASRAGR